MNLDGPILDRNPVRLLLDFLRDPDADRWSYIARAAVTAAMSAAERTAVARAALAPTVEALFAGERPGPSSGDDALYGVSTTIGQLALHGVLDMRPEIGGPNAERWTVITALDDRDAAVSADSHKARWLDWLGWSNLLQFLDGDGRGFVATTICDASKPEPFELAIVPASAATVAAEAAHVSAVSGAAATGGGAGGGAAVDGRVRTDLPDDVLEELGFVLDDAARELAGAVMQRGAPLFVAGYEPSEDGDGWQLEVAWVDQRVGIIGVVDGADSGRDDWLVQHGWTVRPGSEWTIDVLLAALEAAR